GQGQEGARQARDPQAPGNGTRDARRGEGTAALKRGTVARSPAVPVRCCLPVPRLALAALLTIAGAVAPGCGGSKERIDLIDRFAEAQKSPEPGAFTLTETTLAGEKSRAIAIAPVDGSRLTWRIQVP